MAGIVLAGVVSFASWFLLADHPSRGPSEIHLVIAAGTSDAIRRGERGSPVPGNLELVENDVLAVTNDDAVTHRIGDLSVPPGDTVRMKLGRTSSGSLLCTFHPSGTLALAVQGSTGVTVALWPTLILGVPFGIVIAVVTAVTSRLGDEQPLVA